MAHCKGLVISYGQGWQRREILGRQISRNNKVEFKKNYEMKRMGKVFFDKMFSFKPQFLIIFPVITEVPI